MTNERVIATLDHVERQVGEFYSFTGDSVTVIKESVWEGAMRLKEETSVRIAPLEAEIISSGSIVAQDASFHLQRAYFHASPSLILIILAIYEFIKTVIEIIGIINSVLSVITGETLAYWLDRLWPGFQSAWNNVMNKISEFSSLLGWGVDGVGHLMNVGNLATYAWGGITGKDLSGVRSKVFDRVSTYTHSLSTELDEWQSAPGKMLYQTFTREAENNYYFTSAWMDKLVTKLEGAGARVETVAQGFGSMTSEFLALRNDMPSFIANHIPQAIWDGITRADTMINDRLLPRLDQITGKLGEIDALLDKYKADTSALAQRIARPGDLLAEIKALPDYLRKDQEDKIDLVVSGKLGSENTVVYENARVDLSVFDKTYAAMTAPLPSPEFMLIELPARAALTGIVKEPRETWFAGDY